MTLRTFPTTGWYEITSEGQVTLYLCITDEGMVTSPSDSPANTQFRPRVIRPESFSIKRAPQCWVWGSTGGQGAAFGQLELDNYDGLYNDLLDMDVRDSVVTIKILDSAVLLTGAAFQNAITVCTAIIDDVQSDDSDHIILTLKDTIARLDRVLPTRYNPPYVDPGAANVMIPLTFGACRNIKPLLIDSANRIFQLHDSNIPNVTRVADKAAPLDPYADPPQYVPAISGSGIQLDTMPVGALSVDCSSYGVQSVIPGASDVLAYSGGSYGDFTTTWTGVPSLPPGWAWTNNAGSSVVKLNNYLHTGMAAAHLTTSRVWVKGVGGDALSFPGILEGGRAYRLNFSVANILVSASTNPANMGGLMVATSQSNNARDYISGYGTPINGIGVYPNPPSQNLSFEFTVPPGASRDLIFIVTTTRSGSSAVGTCILDLWNITLELLGQYQELPEAGIPMENYFHEILVHRAGEDAAIFNSTEAAALTTADDGSLIPFGIHFDNPPNIMAECIVPAVNSFRAVVFTDNLGTLRIRKFTDPTDPTGTVIADFDSTNIMRPYGQAADKAQGLTTLIGARHNWFVHGAADFVTDQVVVPQDVKTRFSRTSQYQRTSSRSPAGEYSHAIGAPAFESLIDDADLAQIEIDETVGIYSPTIYSDGSFTSGKRKRVTFTAVFDEFTLVGSTIQTNINNLIFGALIRFTAENGDGTERYEDQQAEIVEWEPIPFAKRIKLTVEF